MGMRGPKLMIALVIVTMASTFGYIVHTSRQVAGADEPVDRRSANQRQLDQAFQDVETAMGGQGG
jgi:hypothetical protein